VVLKDLGDSEPGGAEAFQWVIETRKTREMPRHTRFLAPRRVDGICVDPPCGVVRERTAHLV